YVGSALIEGKRVAIEDLPGTYSLAAISPDEQIVVDVLDPNNTSLPSPEALLVTLDATTLKRSLPILAQVLATELPVCVVLTFTDELARRNGHLDLAAFARGIGVPIVAVANGSKHQLGQLKELLADPAQWTKPVILPPTDPPVVTAWSDSVLDASGYVVPEADQRTRKIDAVLLHPVWGSLVFFATMFVFFQVIFTVAAPMQAGIEQVFAFLAKQVAQHVQPRILAAFLGDGLIGGVGSVLVFLPQIALLFVMISLMEGVGYMSRAAFLMDRIMAKAGLEGRAFVALLSSMACAIPGIMATRTLPSMRDRIATMMSAPLMTCSARLPVYVLLIGLLVPSTAHLGPIGAQGLVMFALYLAGAISAMLSAWVISRIGRRNAPLLPFYMEMPPYRFPSWRSVLLSVWDACRGFLLKVGKIILVTTTIMWLLLNLPMPSPNTLREAGIDPSDHAAVAAYTIDHSVGAGIGRAVEPVFAPLGFDWRINVAVIASLSAREVFVATLGQVAAAENPDQPTKAIKKMTVSQGPLKGEPLFSPEVTAALLVFFLFALQCMSTLAALRRESGTWRWPAITFGYLFILAWVGAFITHTVVAQVM
ncbi:MAG TPA: ferrous iron transporter B, partial [Marmoricola sp.]|nr:ferrous iron transporter B [Marmoricola sp.]